MPVVSLPMVERAELLLSSLEAEREVTLVSEEGLLLPTSSLLLALHSPSLASLLASLPPTPPSISVPAPALPLRLLLKLLSRGVVEGGETGQKGIGNKTLVFKICALSPPMSNISVGICYIQC